MRSSTFLRILLKLRLFETRLLLLQLLLTLEVFHQLQVYKMANVHQSCKRDGWSKSKVACEQNHKIAEFYLILWSPVLFLCHDLTEPHNVTFPHSLIFYLWHMILGTSTPPPSPPLYPPTHTKRWLYRLTSFQGDCL